MALLDHENLDVYHRSIEFLTLALRLVGRLPRGEREIRDQLKRAAMSVPLNIAEGRGSRLRRIGRGFTGLRGGRRWSARLSWMFVGWRGSWRGGGGGGEGVAWEDCGDAVEDVSDVRWWSWSRSRSRSRSAHVHAHGRRARGRRSGTEERDGDGDEEEKMMGAGERAGPPTRLKVGVHRSRCTVSVRHIRPASVGRGSYAQLRRGDDSPRPSEMRTAEATSAVFSLRAAGEM